MLDEKTDMEAAAFQALAKAELVGERALGMLPPPEETVLPLQQSAVSAAAASTAADAVVAKSADDGALRCGRRLRSRRLSRPQPASIVPGLLPGGGYFEAAPTARSLLNGKSLPMPKRTPTSAADADYTGNTTVTTRFADAANSVPSALPPAMRCTRTPTTRWPKRRRGRPRAVGASGCGSDYYTPTPPRLLVPAPSASCGSARSGASTGRRGSSELPGGAGGGDRTARRIASGFDQLASQSPRGWAYVGRDSGWRDKEGVSWYGV